MARRLIPPVMNRVMKGIPFISSSKTIQVGWITQFGNSYSTKYSKDRFGNSDNGVMRKSRNPEQYTTLRENTLPEVQYDSEPMQDVTRFSEENIGKNVSRKDKHKFLIDTLLGLKESKESVYGTLDAWVAWEQRFPIASLRMAVGTLEKEQEWHRVIQVLKWILSKGQGNTMGLYRQLINALDKDNRPEEAHNFWMKKIGTDLHSVPWNLCTLMISIYYRNNMLERLVKLFKGLQSYDRKPPDKLVIQRVADAYEMLGLLEEKNRVLEKYNDLFTEKWRGDRKKSKKASQKKLENSDRATYNSDNLFTEKWEGNRNKSKKASQKKLEDSVERNQTETYKEESNRKGVQMSSSIQSSTMDDARVLPCIQQNKKIDLIETVHRMIRS